MFFIIVQSKLMCIKKKDKGKILLIWQVLTYTAQ